MAHDEAEIERQIQDKGLNAPRLSPADIDSLLGDAQYHVVPGTTVTVCAITLLNGFVVVGTSAAASPANFDEDIGRQIAYRNAREQVWALAGYALRDKLAKLGR